MKNRRINSHCILGAGALLVGMAGAASAALVEVKFATQSVTNQNPDNAAWVAALAGLNVTPGGITGKLFYESTTPGDAGDPVRNYNGAIDSLQFTVAGWFSQSLTSIGLNGDIQIQNNNTGQADQDGIRARVVCMPAINAGSQCSAQPFNFNYSFIDSAGTTWALDQFTLLLQESGAAEPLSDLSLPSKEQWESTTWNARRIDLRFNPSGVAGGNVNERASISFLAVPEPGIMALLGLGLLGLGIMRRRA
jgi:PEP-CTERM motif